MYDEAAISAEFRALAAQADNRVEDFRRGLTPGSDADEIVAQSCIFSHLYDRYFLESAEKLLNELRWLQQTGRPRPPEHCISVERFVLARDRILAGLVARFAGSAGGSEF